MSIPNVCWLKSQLRHFWSTSCESMRRWSQCLGPPHPHGRPGWGSCLRRPWPGLPTAAVGSRWTVDLSLPLSGRNSVSWAKTSQVACHSHVLFDCFLHLLLFQRMTNVTCSLVTAAGRGPRLAVHWGGWTLLETSKENKRGKYFETTSG